MKQQDLSEAEAFFGEYGDYGLMPGESEEQARQRGARELAVAEARLKAGPYIATYANDPIPYDGGVPWDGPVWIVQILRLDDSTDFGDAEILGVIGGVAAEYGDFILRVITAQLALECLPSPVEDIQVVSSWNGAIRDDQGRIRVSDGQNKHGWATLSVKWDEEV